nr:FAD-dependent oxidoreductase [uncultured Dyadobacter sp.]
MKRGEFIKLTAGMAAMAPLLHACRTEKPVPGKMIGASAAAGHLLRDHKFGAPAHFEEKEVVIVGAGVSGLSAGRHLMQNGIADFTLLDLEQHVGGNSASGTNAVSQYPWGAHYVPVPNNSLTEYLSFLSDAGVITHYDDAGLPVYDEFALCHDPEERLYINGKWQEGLVPNFGLPGSALQEFRTFFQKMEGFKRLTGSDGKEAFAIPVNTSSRDASITALDKITMKEWMDDQQLTSEYIRWYVDYCTRDDFGTNYDTISAWAGIHYFASRKGKAANASYHDVLTWEQGNGFLVQQLQNVVKDNIRTGSLVISVKAADSGVEVSYLDLKTKKIAGFRARQCIMAVPQFVGARLLDDAERSALVHGHLHYGPWMVANLTVNALEERSGQAPSWDNVIYGSQSLGYVDATHQQVRQVKGKRNLTYYLPLTDGTPAQARQNAFATDHASWAERILADLRLVHPDIRERIENIDIMLWGHAMVQPLPGVIHGEERRKLAESVAGRIHFAHTDIAGVSIFEEAFYQGIGAARKVIRKT